MASRLFLQAQLEQLLGSPNVYFQPPESVKMNYPAIVYALDDLKNAHADDGVYLSYKRYSVTVSTRIRIALLWIWLQKCRLADLIVIIKVIT